MTSVLRIWWLPRLALAAGVVLLSGWLLAADKAAHSTEVASTTVEMFSAIEKGQIAVQVIPKDSKQCRVMIENKTDKPLTVKLPEAFVGVPVLAQIGGGFGGGGLGNDIGGGGGMNQTMGGGMGGMGMGGMGGMGGGMGGGFFNVPPEKVGQFKLNTVCLEHGKDDPNPRVPYEIRPISQFTDKAEVHEICSMLGRGLVNQRVAQVAAWHLANNMSWQELAAKQIRRANGLRQPYFSPQEIALAMQAVANASQIVQQRQADEKSGSLSQR